MKYGYARVSSDGQSVDAQVGLVVTDGSKVPIWKALSINGLRHGARNNLLIFVRESALSVRHAPCGPNAAERSKLD